MILCNATYSWLRGVGAAQRLPRYRLAQADQLRGITWYLPYEPEPALRASKRPLDSTHARPVMNSSMPIRRTPSALAGTDRVVVTTRSSATVRTMPGRDVDCTRGSSTA